MLLTHEIRATWREGGRENEDHVDIVPAPSSASIARVVVIYELEVPHTQGAVRAPHVDGHGLSKRR